MVRCQLDNNALKGFMVLHLVVHTVVESEVEKEGLTERFKHCLLTPRCTWQFLRQVGMII